MLHAKYLSCMGLFYWSLGNPDGYKVMVTQGLGYSGRTVFSGVAEMVAMSSCQPWICRNIWLHSNLFCGPGSMDRSMLLQCSDLPVVREEVNCKTETD